MSTTPVLLAIDGNSVFHRAWHAYERTAMADTDGNPTFATYGFWALVAGICDKTNPDGIVIGFDSARNDRKGRYPLYKAQRSEKPDGFAAQMDATRRLAGDLGVTVVEVDGWEADDVVGSAARAAADAGWTCMIATSDRDAFALIDDTTSVLRLGNGLDSAVVYDAQVLVDKYGIRPDQYLSYAAMRGDTSDNLPGITGVGEKTAQKIIAVVEAARRDVEAVAENPAEWKKPLGAAAAKVAAGIDNYTRNLDIMAIRRDLPVDVDGARLGSDPAAVAATLTRWGLPGLVSRLAVAFGSTAASTDGVFGDDEGIPVPNTPDSGDPFAGFADDELIGNAPTGRTASHAAADSGDYLGGRRGRGDRDQMSLFG